MPKNRVLVAWIGHTDLAAMADDLPEPERARMLDLAGIRGKYGDKPGPLKTAVENEEFDEIHLLSNYDTAVQAPFKRWLGGRTTIHPVELTNPTEYAKVFEVADRFLAEVTTWAKQDPTELCIHLSPGTPAMAATWVLLGKSRYPATFYQSHKGKFWSTLR